jgi:bifunctional DNA-binding transcriptional regulator/antitoxin component of YhaV-PrlF toxin-antitoxin module
MVFGVVETTYHKEKMYLPREVQEKLGLEEGDRIHIDVIGNGEARLSVVRSVEASKRILERLENPPDLGGISGRLSRGEIYEDIAGHKYSGSCS